jgi:GTP-binding protein LepA
VVLCSAKDGIGIDDVLEAIVERIPSPSGDSRNPLSALIFDARYDPFRGAIISCRLFDGSVKAGDPVRLMSMGTVYKVEEVGIFHLERTERDALEAGDVGYIIAGIKTVSDTRIGDTVTNDTRPAQKPLPGFKDVKPVVFSSIYPIDADDNTALGDALERYKLNDAALIYQRDSSVALGNGYRCGFLGLLHMEIFQERLEREFDQAIVMTAPSVRYRFVLESGEKVAIDNPEHYPDPSHIDEALEPYIRAIIIFPERYLGAVMKLCLARRGENSHFSYPGPGRIELLFDMPLAEVIYDFYDKLKNITQGYGSFDYEMLDYRPSRLIKLDILVNGDKVDALSVIVHEERARPRALEICERLKEEIPRHLFKVAIQGAVGGKIIARTNVSAMRKDVTAKCYGGDITRKRKLLEKQAKGKRRMKMVGKVMIPQSAFVSVLKTKDE